MISPTTCPHVAYPCARLGDRTKW